MKSKIITSYGYKVSIKPPFAGVDHVGLFFPIHREDDPKCVGRVLSIGICAESAIAKLYMDWKVDYFLEKPITPLQIKMPQRIEVENSSTIKVELPLTATCELTILREDTTPTLIPPHM